MLNTLELLSVGVIVQWGYVWTTMNNVIILVEKPFIPIHGRVVHLVGIVHGSPTESLGKFHAYNDAQ